MTTQLQLDCSLYVNSKNILSVPVEKGRKRKTAPKLMEGVVTNVCTKTTRQVSGCV